MNNIVEANKDTFEQEVLKSDKAVVVKFYRKEGCKLCAIMEGNFQAYAAQHPEIKCVAYACGGQPDAITSKYPFAQFPAFIGFVNGEPIREMAVKTLMGVMPVSEIGDVFKSNVKIEKE